MYIYIWYTAALNGKLKPRHFSLICLVFAHCANESLSYVGLLTKKQTEFIRCKWADWTKWTCTSMHEVFWYNRVCS